MSKSDSGTRIAELYGLPTDRGDDWAAVVGSQNCPFLGRKCLKNRKSEAEVTIGTCTMRYGRSPAPIMICPFRLLEHRKIFHDCIHLLKQHEPGNELRIVAELPVPGGSIDYCLVSVRDGKAKDFVGIELQTLDTTGTVWPERQRFLLRHDIKVRRKDVASSKSFGMNWKMTAKTVLIQLNHKVATFEHLCRRLVLVMQDCLLDYMRREFSFGHIRGQRDGDPMQFHAYQLAKDAGWLSLKLKERVSTDTEGVATCLGLQADTKVELQAILALIESRLPQSIQLTVGGALPVPKTADMEADDES